MYTYYLIDHEYAIDEEKGYGQMGHLLAFNPGLQGAILKITLYFTDREPINFDFQAPAMQSSETNYEKWPIKPDVRFAMQVDSPVPLACQSTVGWNVTRNDYSPQAKTKSPLGIRECAKSYMAIERLSQDWYLPDGIVIDMPDAMYVRESEWAVMLNPGDQPAQVRLAMHFDKVENHQVIIPPRRLKVVYMDDVARRNAHYGVHFHSDVPIAVQWLRNVYWYHSDELMAYWSVPCVAGPLG